MAQEKFRRKHYSKPGAGPRRTGIFTPRYEMRRLSSNEALLRYVRLQLSSVQFLAIGNGRCQSGPAELQEDRRATSSSAWRSRHIVKKNPHACKESRHDEAACRISSTSARGRFFCSAMFTGSSRLLRAMVNWLRSSFIASTIASREQGLAARE